jgi:L-ribulose-5-phosphate 3-epimerase
MNPVSFMSANFVARQVGYQMTEGWMQGDTATNAYFAPLPTYRERFGALLAEVQAMGFAQIDLWLAHLHWAWATPDHLAIAKELLAQHGLQVASLAGGFGATPAEFAATCRIAQALGTTILGGSTPLLASDRAGLVELLREYGLVLALENHPEKNPAELLAKLGSGDDDLFGVAVDTGWFGTQGYNAAEAIRELGPRVFHVHLKDVRAAGAHQTCRFGQGIVPLHACVQALRAIGYTGSISVEHEPETFDPTEDCVASAALLRIWLNEEGASS